MKTIGNIRKLFLLLALIVAGVQSVKAGYHRYTFYQTKTIDNLTYDIYLESYSDNGSFYFGTSFSYAVLKGISGTAEEVTIPFMLDDHTYVSYVDGTISNSSVKSLTFTGSISFTGSLSTGSSDVTIDGFLNCPNLQTIIIENGNITLKYFRENSPTFKCPNLTDIYFKNNTAPEFKGEWYCESDGIAWRNPSWSHICSAPGSNVTAHVEAWTQEVCDQMHQSANVYKDLKAVVPAGKAVVTVAVSGGARFLADGIGELSDEMTTTKYLERNSNLTFYAYPSNSNCYVAHVYVNDTDVKNQMTPTSDGRLQYTLENLQDDVVIRVVGEEKVKITVSVEEAGAGNGVLFRYNKDEYIYGRGTKTYTKIKHIDYTFYVADGNKATIKNVFVNGEDVYQDLVEVTDSENPFYDASNVRKYTIENVNSDITIRITSVETVDHYTLCAGSGGKIEFDFDNTHHSYANNNYCQLAFNKSQTLTVTATPDEGYEFESFWFEGMKLDSDMGEWITMETQDDGKFVVNLALGTYEVPFTDNSYVVAFTFKNTSNPTWSIHNETEADVIVEQTLKNGSTETATYAGNLNDLVIDDTQVSKVTLKVYAENANEAKPVRVLLNGQDVSYQFNTMPNDGDGFRLCYEVPVSELTNCSWDISYNTDHAQTFVVKGGSRDLLVEVEHEILEGDANLSIFPNDGPATIYLPPYDSEYNSNIDMKVYANAGEGVMIKRNGFDVTGYFTETAEGNSGKCFSLDISEDDFEGNSTVSQFGFDIREAAVWEIVYKSIEEQKKTLRVSNTDQMEIVYERHYTNGSTASEYFKNSETGEIAEYRELFFDDSDRENTSSICLKVPITEGNPIRVMLNGEDVTYSQYDEWINEEWVSYMASAAQDQTWNFSYDTSHKQTFIVKGGLYPEVNYEYKTGDIFKGVQVGGITEVCLPDYNNSDYDNTYAYFTIGTLPNESFTALRNGVDVTDKFTKEVVSDNLWRYTFNFDNPDVAAALGVDLRDPAVWQITIGDTGRYDLNNDNKVDISDVTKLVNKVLNR